MRSKIQSPKMYGWVPQLVATAGTAGLLAAAAIVGVGGTAYGAEGDGPCGTPARDAIYTTVKHAAIPAVFETVVVTPARTEQKLVTAGKDAVTEEVSEWFHSELPIGEGWEPTGQTREHVTRAAVAGSDAEGYDEHKWSKVIPAVTVDHPAEYQTVVTQREYRKYKGLWPFGWWDEQWFPANANPEGWSPTGKEKKEQRLVENAWTEVLEPERTEYKWSAESPGEGWTQTNERRWVETAPAVDPVEEESHTDFQFVRTVVVEPAVDPVYETVTIPEVTDQQLVKAAVPAWTETKLQSPAVPAGPPCEDGRPAQPQPLVTVDAGTEIVDCDLEVASTTTTTTTTPYVWDEAAEEWLPGDPIVSSNTEERPATEDECPPPAETPAGQDDEVKGAEGEETTDGGKTPAADGPGHVLGVSDVASPAAAPVAVPTAVDAGLGAVRGGEGPVDHTGGVLAAGGLMALLFAAWNQFGRRGRDAHQQ